MSQPWRPSRGTGASRWGNVDRSNASQSTRPQAETTPRRPFNKATPPRDDSIIGVGMRTANLRPLRENKMDFSSPSRGELTPGRSLTDKKAQEDFRAHLEDRVAKYYATFPEELGIIVSHDIRQKDELDLILLEFRKLREGIISSSRSDDFAVEVYETSAKLALLGRNIPQIASILPHLVKTLHQPSKSAKKNTSKDLETGLERLALNEKQDISLDTRARFLSYYMLHLICHMEDAKAFQQLLQDSVSFGLDLSTSTKIPYSNKHVKFAVQILHCFLHNNYAALSKITFNPRSYDKFAWIIVRSAQDAFRARAWKALKTSYMLVEDRLWLARQLQLDGDEQLSAFLKRENWEGKTDEKSAVLLKKG